MLIWFSFLSDLDSGFVCVFLRKKAVECLAPPHWYWSDVLFPEFLEGFVRHHHFRLIEDSAELAAADVGADEIRDGIAATLHQGIFQDIPAVFVDEVRQRFAIVLPLTK